MQAWHDGCGWSSMGGRDGRCGVRWLQWLAMRAGRTSGMAQSDGEMHDALVSSHVQRTDSTESVDVYRVGII